MNATTAQTATVIDPVCHMQINPAKAVGSSKFGGETYYFCSRGCEKKFDAAPDSYVQPKAAEPAGCCSTASGSSCC